MSEREPKCCAADDTPPMDGKDTHGRDTSLYGGQAVIEGVMMKGRRRAVVACRNPKGEIVSKVLLDDSEGKAAKGIRRLPFLRGFFILVDSVSLGIKALNFSAEVAMPEERSGKRDACATIEGEKRKGKAAKADEQSVEGGEGK